MALPPGFYSQEDQDIYSGGDHFITQAPYRLDYKAPPSIANAPNTGITNTQAAVPYIWPPKGGGGGGGGGAGGGIWGNLDLSKSKTFTKDVWSQAGPPNEMDWVSKDVIGYYNPTLGQYQTLGGKNINHLGINVPSMAGMLLDKDWGKTMPGDIKGTFTEGWDKGLENIKEGWEAEKEKFKNIGVLKKWRENKAIKKEAALQAEIAADNLKAAQDAQQARATSAADRRNIQQIQDYTGEALSDYRMSRPASERQYTGHGTSGMGRSADRFAAEGGRIGYNRGRVVNPGGYQGDEEFEDENIFEFMQDQGIPHSEMAEGKSAFDLRVQELVDEGMSWQEAWSIASQEFGRLAEGPEESFSEEGIASIV